MVSRTENRSWSKAFARQALSDLQAREVLTSREVGRCHQLHFLQMATEKMCKAHLYAMGTPVKESHSVIRKHLPAILRKFGSERNTSIARLKALKLLAAEIEMLAPAARGEGSRPDNAEYPWQGSHGSIIAPIDFAFESIDDRLIPGLVKLLKAAASNYTS